MATFRSIGGGNVSVKYKTIATAAANQTYGAQLTQLKATYDTLTDEEQLRTIIIYGTSKYYFIKTSANSYSRLAPSQNSVAFSVMNVAQPYYYTISINSSGTVSSTDNTDHTNSTEMYLMLLSNY